MRMRSRLIAKLLAVLTTWMLVSGFGFSSSAPEAWEDWAQSNAQDTSTIDHSAWTAILETHVIPGQDGLNRFAYSKLTADDKKALAAYIASMEAIEITSFNKNEQLAYWINLYNAVTVKVIADHYPVKSIRDIDISGFLKNGPWQKELVTVEETPLTLDNIEHAILRPIWKDPRIHYGVNCASVGCPNLRTKAFTSTNVDAELEQGAVDYINSPRGVLIKANGKVVVSSIYSWFAHDFGNSEKGVTAHLLKYAKPELAAAIKKAGSLSDHHYDWSLNE